MKVEIVHTRDSDSACIVEVFVDGVQVEDFTLISVDPGVGHSCDDLVGSQLEALRELSTAAGVSARFAYELALENEDTEHPLGDNGICACGSTS